MPASHASVACLALEREQRADDRLEVGAAPAMPPSDPARQVPGGRAATPAVRLPGAGSGCRRRPSTARRSRSRRPRRTVRPPGPGRASPGRPARTARPSRPAPSPASSRSGTRRPGRRRPPATSWLPSSVSSPLRSVDLRRRSAAVNASAQAWVERLVLGVVDGDAAADRLGARHVGSAARRRADGRRFGRPCWPTRGAS